MNRTASYVRSQRHLPPKFLKFEERFVPGVPAADLEVTDVDGRRLRLSSLWTEKPLILEFGSAT